MMQPRRLLKGALAIPLALLLAWTSAGQVFAEGPPTVLSLRLPEAAELGEEVEVIATLRTEAGDPVSGARITFFAPAEFGGVAGNMVLGSSVTDAQGTTVFQYALRQSGTINLSAYYPGDALSGASGASASLTVRGERQLYIAEAGVQIPFLSVFFLAGALAVVFILYTAVGLLIFGIAMEGEKATRAGGTRE